MATKKDKQEVKRNQNGTYTLGSENAVRAALLLMKEMEAEIDSLMEEHGIREAMQDAVELKKAAQRYMIDNGMETVELPDGSYGRVIAQSYDKRWILTDDEIEPYMKDAGVKSLRSILKKKFGKQEGRFKEVYRRITKRVVNPEAIEQMITDGELTAKLVAPAFVEKTKAPYLRIYGEGDNE